MVPRTGSVVKDSAHAKFGIGSLACDSMAAAFLASMSLRLPSAVLRPTPARLLTAPGIWDVFTSGPRVRSSVPVGARDAWSRCLFIALADVIAHRDVRSWTDLLTLPALVLADPSRGGRRHTFSSRQRHSAPLPGLGQRGLAPLSFRTLLSAPRARWSLLCLRMNALPWVPWVVSRHAPLLSPRWIRFVRPCTPSLPLREPVVRGSSHPTFATPCGRPRQISCCVSLLRWSVSFSKVRFPSRSVLSFVERPSWLCASPTGLFARSLSERPFAALPARSPLSSSRIGRTILEPLQLGVKTPNGCEAIIHTTRQWFHRHRLDPSLTATCGHSCAWLRCPSVYPHSLSFSLAPWVDCCYRHGSHLFTSSSAACDQVIPSTRRCNRATL